MAPLFSKLADFLESGWSPLAGRQSEAYYSQADILLYGGAAGGGKTDLLLGLAATAHQKSIIFRRTYPQLQGIEDRARELLGALGEYNATKRIWRLHDKRQIEFGAVQLPGDEVAYQGRAHSLIGFDECTHFTEGQFRFLLGWLRSTVKGERCRVVCTGNPPTGAEGAWIIAYFGPWLDERHPNPAKPGELRWFAVLDGKDTEVPSGAPFEHNGETIQPKSRTFIPARISDNPYLADSGYKAQLQALPEPLRSMMLEGNFGITQEDDPWQLLPTAWVKAAQERWTPDRPDVPMTALGVDVARGGRDKTVLTPRYAHYFAEQIVVPGAETPNGQAVVRLILEHREDNADVNIDVIGVGTSPTDVAEMAGIDITAMNGAAATSQRDQSGRLTFVNQRALWWWRLREALDPSSGEDLMIPPDRELLADLCSPRWKLMTRGIQIEAKPDIISRIGRSPDKGESLVYAHGDPGSAGMTQYLCDLAKGPKPRPKEVAATEVKRAPAPTALIKLKTTPGRAFWIGATKYVASGDGIIECAQADVLQLRAQGCRIVKDT